MRNILLPAVLVLLAMRTNAQITLSASSYPASLIGTDSLKVTTAATAFPSLSAMANGSWDLSSVTDSTPVLFAYRVPTTTYDFADSNFYSFSTYNYQGNVQSSIVSSGLLEYGINVQRTWYSLTSVTSGANDSLIMPTQADLFSSPRTKIIFPAFYNSSWASAYHFDFDFIITVALVPLSHAPGIVSRYVTEQDSVVGWGRMRVKDLSGLASDWFDVLQVQTKVTALDSFFINGVPAAATLLTALGLTQGQITNTYEQNYYRPEEVTPFANVRFSDSTYAIPTKATTHTQRLINVGVANVADNSGVSIYPNPVCGDQVAMTLPSTSDAWSYELIDINGKAVAAGVLATTSDKSQLTLPRSIAPGIYHIKLSSNGHQVCVRSIDVVK